jgi:hypothetical protein
MVNLVESGARTSVTQIRYRSSLLKLLNPVQQEVRIGQESVVSISSVLRPGNDTLAVMEFLAMLGDVDSTVLHFESHAWNEAAVLVTAVDGLFRLKICREGGARLIDGSKRTALLQNRPNPFNAATSIEFETAEKGMTKVSVFDMLGRVVAEPLRAELEPGKYSIAFNSGSLPSGTFIYVLETPSQRMYKLMEIIK